MMGQLGEAVLTYAVNHPDTTLRVAKAGAGLLLVGGVAMAMGGGMKKNGQRRRNRRRH